MTKKGKNGRIRVGVVGAGYFGRLHAQKYAALEAADLVAVVDPNEETGHAVAEEFSTIALTDHKKLIGKVDAVSIVTPTKDHYHVAMDFLSNGVDVLMEKPICSTLEEADALIDLAHSKELILQVGHLERFTPAIRELRKYINRPRFIECTRISPFRGRGTDTTVILDMMIHDIDHVLTIAGKPVERIDAVGVPVLSPEEDIANARIQFEDGCVANITASRISSKIERVIRIFQPDAYIVLDMNAHKINIMRLTSDEKTGKPAFGAEEMTFDQADHLLAEIDSFVQCVRDRSEPKVTGEAGREALRAALTITDQLRQWRMRAFDPDA